MASLEGVQRVEGRPFSGKRVEGYPFFQPVRKKILAFGGNFGDFRAQKVPKCSKIA
jgi:hypothetical protein